MIPAATLQRPGVRDDRIDRSSWPAPLMRRTLAIALVLVIAAPSALAYIGPGAGFAFAGFSLALVGTFLLAFGIILTWPFKAAVRLMTPVRRGPIKARRVVVI